MIIHLTGEVLHKDSRFLVVETGGIGYKVSTVSSLAEKSQEGDEISLWTHHAVREDSETLFGFEKKEELDVFELLISVSGIGPKTALSILNISSIAILKRAVSTGDTAHLTKVSGIGKKIAEKIVLELKDKLVSGSEDEDTDLKGDLDAVEALKAIGYNQHEAREALKKVSGKASGTGERVKQALKILSNK